MLAPAVGIASSDDGGGYWVITAGGQVFNFGDAKFEGSLVNEHLTDPVVGIAADPITDGYWLLTQRVRSTTSASRLLTWAPCR